MFLQRRRQMESQVQEVHTLLKDAIHPQVVVANHKPTEPAPVRHSSRLNAKKTSMDFFAAPIGTLVFGFRTIILLMICSGEKEKRPNKRGHNKIEVHYNPKIVTYINQYAIETPPAKRASKMVPSPELDLNKPDISEWTVDEVTSWIEATPHAKYLSILFSFWNFHDVVKISAATQRRGSRWSSYHGDEQES